jgi:hypothetical protein
MMDGWIGERMRNERIWISKMDEWKWNTIENSKRDYHYFLFRSFEIHYRSTFSCSA